MQTLWSRAIKTTTTSCTCKCNFCLSTSANAVARRASTATAKTLLRAGPSSTFLYSAIFAAAVVADGRAKQQRRNQWNEAIAAAKAGGYKVNDGPREDDKKTSSDDKERQVKESHDRGDVEIEDMALSVKGSRSARDGMDDKDWHKEGPNGQRKSARRSKDAVHLSTTRENDIEADVDSLFEVSGTEVVKDGPKELDYTTDGYVDAHIRHPSEYIPLDSRMPFVPRIPLLPNTGERLSTRHLPPQSLWSKNNMRQRFIRRRKTWKKMKMMELSIAKLVHSLILDSGLYHLSSNVLGSPTISRIVGYNSTDLKFIITECSNCLYALANTSGQDLDDTTLSWLNRQTTFTMPSYQEDRGGDFYEIAAEMNNALKNLLHEGKKASSRDQAIIIGKLCHNLLISTAPPNVQTYNILLTGLHSWNRPELSRSVIASILQTRTRPNEITCAAVLEHAIDSNDPVGFSDFVARMCGLNNGLMLARHNIKITSAGHKRLVRKPGNEGKIIQKVYPTPMVFNQLMKGLLKFTGLDRAMDIYHEMQTDGWGLDIRGLNLVLEECLHQGDWHNGSIIWNEMQILKRKHRKAQIHAATYARMLCLCDMTRQHQAGKELLNEAVEQGWDAVHLQNLTRDVAEWVTQKRWSRRITKDGLIAEESNKIDERDAHLVADGVWNYVRSVNDEASDNAITWSAQSPMGIGNVVTDTLEATGEDSTETLDDLMDYLSDRK